MNYDVPKFPQKPPCVVERSVIRTADDKGISSSPFLTPPPQAESFGGAFVTGTAGTANATASPSAPASSEEYLYFISESGVIPEVEMERQQVASNMERAVEIDKNKA